MKYSFAALLLKLAVLDLVLFLCLRLLFCGFNFPADNDEGFAGYALAFLVGLRFDLFVISFTFMLPGFLLFLHQTFFSNSIIFFRIIKGLLIVIGAFVLFMWCAGIPYFTQFGSHISESVMVWRLTPGYVLGLIFSSFSYWGFFLVFLFFFSIYLIVLNRFMTHYRDHIQEGKPARVLISFPVLLTVTFLLFWGARGRLSKKSPIHEGMAIVSHNPFVNQVGLNPTFTFVKSMNRGDHNKGYEHIKEDLQICREFYPDNYFAEDGILNMAPAKAKDSIHPMNIVVVLMESLSMTKMGYYHNKNLSPNLTQLAAESVFFDRFFSSGIHTFNGLFSSVSGFPSIYTEQGLRRYTRKPFPTLAMLLKPYGYNTWFCATHDPVFDNMEGFFRLNGFDNIISSNDFESSQSLGVTGVPDHLLFEKLVNTLDKKEKNRPFLAWVMTGTDHGPWAIPKNTTFHLEEEDSEKENASRYADWAIQQFIEQARKKDWYENTIFVFTGDHGQITYDVYDMPITYHHVPLIIHCPKLLKPELRHTLGYQPDLTKTIASLLKLEYKNPGFGVNIFEEERPFIFFSADDKIGYVTEDDLFFFHLLNSDQKKLVKYKNMSRVNYYDSQKKRADSLYKLTQSLYTASRYIIHKNYFNF